MCVCVCVCMCVCVREREREDLGERTETMRNRYERARPCVIFLNKNRGFRLDESAIHEALREALREAFRV